MRLLILLITAFSLQTVAAQKPKVLDLSESQKQIILPEELKENSGLQFIDNFIYTFNDSGGKAEVYKIEPESGKIIQTIILKKAENIDWEDIAYDGKYIYIGDFGNNLGNRKDLTIYRFELIHSDKEVINVNTRKLRFYISEQTTLKKEAPLVTNFDIESLVFYNNKLHFFTKEWSSGKTTHYTLETQYAFQAAKKIESFDVNSHITSADIINNELYLTGYTKKGEVFLWKFDDLKNDVFFKGKSQQYILGLSASIGQIEGLTCAENGVYISGEEFSFASFIAKQNLYFVAFNSL